jgi:hypothetical protein
MINHSIQAIENVYAIPVEIHPASYKGFHMNAFLIILKYSLTGNFSWNQVFAITCLSY